MTTKEKAAPGRTGTASKTSLQQNSTSPQRQNKDPLIGWYNLASPTLKREAKRQKRGRK